MNKLTKILVIFFVMFGFCYASVDQPLKLLVQRAALMQGVGICKSKLKGSIYDANQEISVLQNAKALAKQNNLEENSFLTFIQLQMDLSKQIENYYLNNATKQQLEQQSTDCLTNYRDKIKKVDAQLYPAISENIKSIRKDKKLASQISELVKKQNIKGIPQDPNYLDLVAYSLQNIKKAKH
ncbi:MULTISPECIES: chorismate mutase [unclassified Francisella]|uniref:chorismate mutase n=1 Tax=unclassified Francisella TaxID=2610885 RepID=UPI002E35DEAF|nr:MULTISPECIES: chorismate mutase [unclassified Francisella]MED7819134.1 chorismate mutase [Francisella sp. 19S2-4]MED7831022.1 chorismate mutase [Francisella sp. 19S2-10]